MQSSSRFPLGSFPKRTAVATTNFHSSHLTKDYIYMQDTKEEKYEIIAVISFVV